ncbi:hypothetical protein ACIQVR_06670 [Streptomyces xanthochromogenes]|uniref:hypothetical protein n=1 Tax=Streptomyces xanthochromogenes TaxID=67384 RepID=UPI00380AC9AF
MSDDFFTTEDREIVSEAGARLYRAFEALGLDALEDLKPDEPCAHRHCCPTQRIMLSLGSYEPDVVNAVAGRLEQIAQALPPS